MTEQRNYNHRDIQRYLQQQMSQQEMYAFEKALLNDPFLADALDGYTDSDASIAATHLSEIERKIKQQQQDGKVIALPATRTLWWKVAAILLVIVSGGIISYSLLRNNSAHTEFAASGVTKGMQQKISADTIKSADKPIIPIESFPQTEVFDSRANSSPLLDKKATAPIAALKPLIKPEFDNSLVTENKDQINNNTAAGSPAIVSADLANVEREVLDKRQNSNDVQQQSPVGAKAKNTRGISQSVIGDTIKMIAGLSRANHPLAKANIKVTDESSDSKSEALSEVVVTASGKKDKNYEAAKKVSAKDITSVEAQPAGGWSNFNIYVQKQVDSIKNVEGAGLRSGNVVVTFDVNKKGQPHHIKIKKETDKLLAEKAEYIILHGPGWSKRNNGSVEVSIPF